MAVAGKEHGIVAVDVQTNAYEDANIWRLEQILAGVGKHGPLHEFDERDAETVLDNAFGNSFFIRDVQDIRRRMARGDTTLLDAITSQRKEVMSKVGVIRAAEFRSRMSGPRAYGALSEITMSK